MKNTLATLAVFALSVTAGESVNAAEIKSISLINTDIGKPIPQFHPIKNGATIDLSTITATGLSIRAYTKGRTKSVKFIFDTNNIRM